MVVRLSDDVLQESGVGFGRIGCRPIRWVRLLKVTQELVSLTSLAGRLLSRRKRI